MAGKNGFDGISYREERKTPPFYKILFWGLVFWGGVFTGYFLLSGWSSGQELERRMEEREFALKAKAPMGHGMERAPEDHLALGKTIFAEKCAVCHGDDAKGKIGPDLTRRDFAYGRSADAITESIAMGRPNGMPPFSSQLSHEQIEALVAYIQSL